MTLTYDHIAALALYHGFKLKAQPDGRMALNGYVIDFARAVYQAGYAAAKAETAPKPPACAADDGWQPIETAPNDTAVLLAWWSNWSEEWNMEVNFAGSTRGGWRHGSATYWRPLPKPPADQGAPDA